MIIQSSSKLVFKNGSKMKNRFALAPMTNQQSYPDGRLSDDEFHWLTMRAKGSFGMVMTCAAHVQAAGQGFPGQLGIFSEIHEEGHRRLAKAIKAEGSLAVIQLHHAGMRSPEDLIGQAPMCPIDQPKYNAKAMRLEEVMKLRDDFILAAKRARDWGYDGVEVHGAHGYILTQFLSAEINERKDQYGGNLENRSRLLFEIIEGIRSTCGSEFLLGLRLSPERFGMDLGEIKMICQKLAAEEEIDFIDISLWDWQKEAEDPAFKGISLLEHFTAIDFKDIKLTIAGKISSASDVRTLLDKGVDFVTIGKAAILHYDFPEQVEADPNFKAIATPVTTAYLKKQGLGTEFIKYMDRWPEFVEK
jgi:2,4-dienoyl-CoA reductase-like NADH-dependent reductase (Old Yellow Enzyme family)